MWLFVVRVVLTLFGASYSDLTPILLRIVVYLHRIIAKTDFFEGFGTVLAYLLIREPHGERNRERERERETEK